MSTQRQRVQPYLTKATAQRLELYAAATHTTISGIVESALRQYLDGTSDLTVIMRRLDRVDRGNERMLRALHMLSEAFATWVRIWYAYSPEVPDDAKARAQHASARRYHMFIEIVARRLRRGKSLFDDIGIDPLADDAELARARAAVTGHVAEAASAHESSARAGDSS